MVWWWNYEMNPKWWNGDIAIWCDGISLVQTCDPIHFISFSKHMENIRRSDLPESDALKIQPESLTYEVIQFCRTNKEQHMTMNRVNSLLEQLCSGNGQQKLYTAS